MAASLRGTLFWCRLFSSVACDLMQPIAPLNVLLIEPHAGMRASLQALLLQCGLNNIEHAFTAGAALRLLRLTRYDVILCEYDLGAGQDGQQLLEDLRQHQLIPLSAVFVLLTAERSHDKIVSAAEFAPADYILKPFTAHKLLERMTGALARRLQLLPVHQLMEQKDWPQALAACLAGEARDPRYSLAFMRLRAELHVLLGEATLAEPLYARLFEQRPAAWAQLGLAKTFFMQDRHQEANTLLVALVREHRHFLDAYDWLARLYDANGKPDAAQAVLEGATRISPHAVQRLRKLGEIALRNGDSATAERAFTQVLSKGRFSAFRDPQDHLYLLQTLVAQGNAIQAAVVLRELDQMPDATPKGVVCRALSACLVHAQAGDTDQSAAALEQAVLACRDSTGLPASLKMVLAQSCLDHARDTDACDLLSDVVSNAADVSAVAAATVLFARAGRQDLADHAVAHSRRQVTELITAGADKARHGDYQGAVDLMSHAVLRMPDNPRVVFNAAIAMLKCLEHLGWDSQMGEQVKSTIARARQLDPGNARLAPLTHLYQAMVRKYGVDSS